MKEVQGLPPNYDLIKLAVNPPPHAIFCYGDTIYNLSGETIPEDTLYHESIHEKQQGSNPDLWWTRWLTDKQFRYNNELEAYAYQFKLIKQHYPQKAQKMALTELASNLKNLYGLDISLGEAESKIRNYATD